MKSLGFQIFQQQSYFIYIITLGSSLNCHSCANTITTRCGVPKIIIITTPSLGLQVSGHVSMMAILSCYLNQAALWKVFADLSNGLIYKNKSHLIKEGCVVSYITYSTSSVSPEKFSSSQDHIDCNKTTWGFSFHGSPYIRSCRTSYRLYFVFRAYFRALPLNDGSRLCVDLDGNRTRLRHPIKRFIFGQHLFVRLSLHNAPSFKTTSIAISTPFHMPRRLFSSFKLVGSLLAFLLWCLYFYCVLSWEQIQIDGAALTSKFHETEGCYKKKFHLS